MIQVHRGDERGYADDGWLKSYQSFSFGDYQDPTFKGFAGLCVLNEDRVQPKHGFDTHDHKDLEIVTYVLEGQLEHKDSLGNTVVLHPGGVQRISAGTGIAHSEFNPSPERAVHFFQMWLIPDSKGLPPSYEHNHFSDPEKRGRLRVVVSADGRSGSLRIHRDASIYATLLNHREIVNHELPPAHKAYLQVARGAIELNAEQVLHAGDGARIEDEPELRLLGESDAEVLLIVLRR